MKANHTDQNEVSLAADAAVPVRPQRIEQARRRLSAGDYERPEVVETIIAKLISRFAHE